MPYYQDYKLLGANLIDSAGVCLDAGAGLVVELVPERLRHRHTYLFTIQA